MVCANGDNEATHGKLRHHIKLVNTVHCTANPRDGSLAWAWALCHSVRVCLSIEHCTNNSTILLQPVSDSR